MPHFDLPLDQLETYGGAVAPPSDLEAFWQSTFRDADEFPLDLRLEPLDRQFGAVETFDVSFAGSMGHPIRAWLHLPAAVESAPIVVQYPAYGGGRGLPHESILWPVVGVACLVVDVRGQGAGWSIGDTADPVGSGPAHPGFMTRGILDRDHYYYRRVFVDAVRAVDVARSLDRVDSTRVAVMGASQGAGISLAVAGLAPERVSLVVADVPGLCDFPRAIELAERDPYLEITNYLAVHRDRAEVVLRTLSYFDGVLIGAWARARALFSIALRDKTCPPSTGYAAYNAYGGAKELVVYRYNDHEGGGPSHQSRQIAWLRKQWGL